MDIWSFLRPFDIFYGHWVHFVIIRYNFPHVGKLYREKTGNPVLHTYIDAKLAIIEVFIHTYIHTTVTEVSLTAVVNIGTTRLTAQV
jgi:hypothetical protein